MYLRIKRIIDVVVSLLFLVLLAPVFLLIILAIKIDSEGPVFFKQKRVGKDKTHFNILKFRTMRIDTPQDTPTHMLENPEQYITRVGKFLRKTSLDELPQLWNIFIGEMSFIGPRPALWNQFDLIAERDKYDANSVRPGLTGLAQVKGRDSLEIPVKAKFDGDYVKDFGFIMDLKVLFLSVWVVITGKGVVEGKIESPAHNDCEAQGENNN